METDAKNKQTKNTDIKFSRDFKTAITNVFKDLKEKNGQILAKK